MSEQHSGDSRDTGATPTPGPTQPNPASFAVSRRTLVKTAAGAGIAAAAVGMVGVAHASTPSQKNAAAGAPLATTGRSTATARQTAAAGPVVVHVTDFAHGTIEVFTDGIRTQMTDVDLANRIASAAANR